MRHLELPASPVVCKNLLGSEWRDAIGGQRQDIVSPWTGEIIGSVPMSDARDVDAVVKRAREAAKGWRAVPIKERTQTLFRYRELVLRDLEKLSHRAAAEAGKTVGEARAGVLKGIEVIEFALSIQNLDQGGVLEVSRGVTCEVRREPLGVVAGITPFNFPAMVPMWLYPIAITVGNAFVWKPSEKVPMTACLLAELALEAGFPAGVLSLVHGGKDAAEALVDHPDVAALGFVGSTTAARALYVRAAQTGTRALCLGGAKNVLMVVPDADPDVTVPGVVASFTGCAGQRCMAASLLVAVGDVDPLLERIAEAAEKVRLGHDMGAIIDRGARDRLVSEIDVAKKEGARIRLDGRNVRAPSGYENGHWLAPTILDGASYGMGCTTKELFGPIMTVVRVRNLDEALELEQRGEYGNATSVFTTKGAVARYVAENATSGMVGVNVGVPVPREPFSFGGTKHSRFGEGDVTGKSGLEHWSTLKKITSKWELQKDGSWMS